MVGISAAQREATRTALIDAFERRMLAVGVGGVTVTAIAEDAGLARSAFYNYFADIPELFHAYVAREIAVFASERRAELEAIDDPTQQLEQFVVGSLRGFRHQGSPLEAATALGVRHEVHIEEDLSPLRALLRDVLARGVEAGVFRPDAAHPAVVEMLLHALGSQRVPIATGAVDPGAVTPAVVATVLGAVRR